MLCSAVAVGALPALSAVDHFDDPPGRWLECDVDFALGLCLGIGWAVNTVTRALPIQEMELSWNCVRNHCVRMTTIFHIHGHVETIDDWIKNFLKSHCLLRSRWVSVELPLSPNWVGNFSKKIVFNWRALALYLPLTDIHLHDDRLSAVFKGESRVVLLFVCFAGVQLIADELPLQRAVIWRVFWSSYSPFEHPLINTTD